MERIALLGLSLTEAKSADVEALKHSGLSRPELLRELGDALAASEVVVVETCNRVEVVYARELGHPPTRSDLEIARRVLEGAGNGNGHAPAAADRPLHFDVGRDAVRRLFRVAASLDSVVQGEDQILAQLREEFGVAEDAGMVGPLLAPLFDQAFQTGKQVRSRTELSRHSISVMSLGVRELARALEGLSDPRIGILGAGETARHAAQALAAENLGPHLIANRSLERARSLAERYGARAMDLAAFREHSESLDAIVGATGAPGTVLERAGIVRLAARAPGGRGLALLDLASPRDFEPPSSGDPYDVIDLEALREAADANRRRRSAAALEAERLVEERLASFERRSAEHRLAEGIESFVTETNELLDRELARLAQKELKGVDPEQAARIERWARSTFGQMTYLSTRACKALARGSARWQEVEEEETTG